MNSNNPYAAPQTLQPLTKFDDLPAAEEVHPLARRIMFPEVSTETLERLKAASGAIRRMTILWSIATAVLLFGVIQGMIMEGPVHRIPLILLACSIVLAFRIYAGVVRSNQLRYFSLVMDILPSLAMMASLIYGSVSILDGEEKVVQALFFLVTMTLVIVVNVLPFASVRAHLKYSRLFGDKRYRHEEMIQELIHRWKYRIL